jgi:hypothetical protein
LALVNLFRTASISTDVLKASKSIGMHYAIFNSGVLAGNSRLIKQINEYMQSPPSLTLKRGKGIFGFDMRFGLISSKSFFIIINLLQLIF